MWGGHGGGGGRPMFGGMGSAPGLPFAGIPPEYAKRIEALVADEPAVEKPEISFDQNSPEEASFTLGGFLAPHWRALLVSVALVGVETLAAFIGPRLTGLGIDEGVMAGDMSVVGWVGAAYLFSVVAHAGISYARISWTGRLGQRLMYGLRLRVFTHLQRLSLAFYTKEKAGRIMTRMTSDIEALQTLFSEGLVNLAVQGIALLVMIAIMAQMDVKLTLFLVLGIAPVMVVITLWFRVRSETAYERVRNRIADVLADLQESLSGIRIVTMHNRQTHNVVRHDNVVGRHLDANLDAAHIGAIYGSGAEGVGVLAQLLVLLVGGSMVYGGDLRVGELTAFLLYVPLFFNPIQQLVQLHNTYQQGRAAIMKLREVFATAPSVLESPQAVDLPAVEGAIRFENVEFSYGGVDDTAVILRDLDLEIAAGETVALVGRTGAGKSTIAKLATRFYDPQRGRVTIDGCDLRDLKFASLRSQIGVVPQEPFLFAGSIRDNVAFGRPDATDDDVLEACRAVGIEPLIDRLPQGIHTPCHERGVTLSSGERQLIALARAFLSGPRVLILDEATSNLDLQTEAMVERALDALLGGRTAVLIAHRLSTAMRADRIAVVEDGRIAEIGSHAELLAHEGLYAGMYATWVRHGSDPTEATA